MPTTLIIKSSDFRKTEQKINVSEMSCKRISKLAQEYQDRGKWVYIDVNDRRE